MFFCARGFRAWQVHGPCGWLYELCPYNDASFWANKKCQGGGCLLCALVRSATLFKIAVELCARKRITPSRHGGRQRDRRSGIHPFPLDVGLHLRPPWAAFSSSRPVECLFNSSPLDWGGGGSSRLLHASQAPPISRSKPLGILMALSCWSVGQSGIAQVEKLPLQCTRYNSDLSPTAARLG